MWKKWNEPMKNALVPNQKTGEGRLPERLVGSGPGAAGAPRAAGCTRSPINALTLEVYYRYANVFGGAGVATSPK